MNKKLVFTALTTVTGSFLFAQGGFPPAPPPTGGGPGCWPPPCVPIDGGIYYLAFLGISLVAYKLYFKKEYNVKRD